MLSHTCIENLKLYRLYNVIHIAFLDILYKPDRFVIKNNSLFRRLQSLPIHCNAESGGDPCTMYYFKNKLNARNVKGKVRNGYRAYKLLYYTVLDAMCCHLFLSEFNLTNFDDVFPLPDDFTELSPELKSNWLNEI